MVASRHPRIAVALWTTLALGLLLTCGRCFLWDSSAASTIAAFDAYGPQGPSTSTVVRALAELALELLQVATAAWLTLASGVGLSRHPAADSILRASYGIALLDTSVSVIAAAWTFGSAMWSGIEDPTGGIAVAFYLVWSAARLVFFVPLGVFYIWAWIALDDVAQSRAFFVGARARKSIPTGLVVIAMILTTASIVVAPVAVLAVKQLGHHWDDHGMAFQAECGGARVRVRRGVGQGGTRRERHVVGTWIPARGEPRDFAIDTDYMPRHFRGSLPPRTIHRPRPHYVHFFLGHLAPQDAERVERCIEDHANRFMAALDDEELYLSDDVRVASRGRVYWRGRPEQLKPVFRNGGRELVVLRDGTLNHRRNGLASSPGFVRTRADGTVVLRCCLGAHGIRAEEVAQFLDAQGRSLPARLGVPVTPCAPPASLVMHCRGP